MREQVLAIVLRTVDEAGFSPPQEREAEDVEPGCIDDAAVMS